MLEFQKIFPKEFGENPFSLIGDDWTLLCAGDSLNHYNMMTASWGSVGVLWNKPVVTVYVRPQRYTFEFMESSEFFTLSFFTEEYRKALSFCGSKSGREYNKAKECSLSPVLKDGGVGFSEARLLLVCKKLYFNDILPEHFYDTEIDSKNYPNHDYHRMYIGEIIAMYQ